MCINSTYIFLKYLRSNLLMFCIIQSKFCWHCLSLITSLYCNYCLFLLDFGSCKIVIDHIFRAVHKIHIPEDSTHSKFILIFQISSITPFQNQYRQRILPIFQNFRHIKFTCGMGNLTVTYILSIYPDIKAGIHPFKIQICSGRLLWYFIVKFPDIGSAWILLWNIRRIQWNRIPHVSILVAVIPVILPHPRHLYLCKSAAVISLFVKFFLQIVDTVKILKLPCSIHKRSSTSGPISWEAGI